MRLATLQFATRLQKYVRMGIDIFKIFISGDILLGIRSETCFTALLVCCRKTISGRISDETSSQMKFCIHFPLNVITRLTENQKFICMLQTSPIAQSVWSLTADCGVQV